MRGRLGLVPPGARAAEQLSVRVDPNTALAPDRRACPRPTADPRRRWPGRPAGHLPRGRRQSGLSEPHYYLHVRAAAPQEGAYCVDIASTSPGDTECDDEDEIAPVDCAERRQ